MGSEMCIRDRSYPWFNDDLRGINFVARGRDEAQLEAVRVEIEGLVREL